MKRKLLSIFLSLTILITQMSVFAEGNTEGGRNIAEYLSFAGSEDFLKTVEVSIRQGDEIIELEDGDDFQKNMEMNLKFRWDIGEENLAQLEDQVKAHDYLEFKLPENVKIKDNQEYFILDEDGSQNIRVSANKEGIIRLEFLKDGQDYDPIPFKGTIDVSAMLDESKIPEGGPIELLFPVKDQGSYNIHLVPKNAQDEPYKRFSAEHSDHPGDSPKHVSWEIIFNEDYRELKNVVLEEQIEGMLEFEFFEVFKKENDEWIAYEDYTQEGQSLSFDAVSEPVKVLVHTKVDESQLKISENHYRVENKASIKWDGSEEKEVKATVDLNYASIAEKSGSHFNPETRSIQWTVHLNKRSVSLDQAHFKDQFDSDVFEYVQDSLQIINQKTQKKLVEGEDYEIIWSEKSFDLKFLKEIHDPHTMTYDTQVKEDYLINENLWIENKISLEGEETSNPVGSGSQQVGKGILNKYSQQDWIDFDQRSITWRIEINRYKREIENIVLKDTWPANTLTILEDSVKVLKNGQAMGPQDYVFEVQENGFVFKPHTEGPDKSHYVLEFKTSYDARAIQSIEDVHLLNQAHLELDYQGKPWEGDAEASVKIPAQKAQNGFKEGRYNAESKEITWDIYSNYNEFELENAYLEDHIDANQKLLKDSVQVFEYRVKANGSVEIGREITEEVQDALNIEDQSIRFDFPKGNQRYLIRFKTTVITEDEGTVLVEKEYQNKAKVHYGEGEDYVYDANVRLPHESLYIKKHGEYLGKNSNEILWTIVFNESQSLIKNAVITDQPDENQIVDYESLEITVLKMKANGQYEESSEKLILDEDYRLLEKENDQGQKYFEIHFLDTVDQALKIEYKSEVSADENSIQNNHINLRNDVFINGFESKTEEGKTEGSLQIFVQDLSGSAYGLKGQLKIKKVDQASKEALEGVEFELYTENGRLVSKGQSDENGEWLVDRNIINRKYILKEVASLDGYPLPKDHFEIDVRFDGKERLFEIEIENKQNQVTLKKINEFNEPLSQVQFELKDALGQVTILESDEKGEIHLHGLKDGHYSFRELKSHQDYILNTESIDFEVVDNRIKDGDNFKDSVELVFVNYQGRVELMKTGHNQEALAGVQYGLYTSDGHLISKHFSGKDGKLQIQGIAPGDYYLQEIETVEGHLVNTEKHPFSIQQSFEGKPSLITLNAENKRASIVFRKVDEEAVGLQGASFNLYRQDDKELIAEGIQSNEKGLVIIENLSPGHYYLEEVEPSEGYLLNTAIKTFEIPKAIEANHDHLFDLGEFVNYQQNLEMKKLDPKGEALAHVRYELYNSEEELLMELESNEEGLIRIENLAPGQYSLKEVESVEGYLIDPEAIVFEVKAEAKGKPETIILDDHINQKARIEVLKLDESGQGLAKVGFTLFTEEGEKVQTAYSNQEGIVVFEDVAYGDYLIQETESLKDYILNEERIAVSIDPIAKEENVYHFEMINYQGEVILSKTDSDKQALEGVQFDLYYEDDLYLEGLESDEAGEIYLDGLAPGSYYFVETASVGGRLVDPRPIKFRVDEKALGKPEVIELDAYKNHFASVQLRKENKEGLGLNASFKLEKMKDDQWTTVHERLETNDGELKINQLSAGKYRLTEIEASEEYLLNTESIDFAIPEVFEGVYELELDAFINYQQDLEMRKVNEKGEALAHVRYELYNSEEKLIMELASNEKGLVRIENLAPGQYSLKEIESVDGYLIDPKPIHFEVAKEAKGQPKVLELEDHVNEKARIEVLKVNESEQALEGVEFTIFTKDGEKVQTAISDEQGLAVFEDIAYGDYVLRETKSLKDYLLNEEEIEISIDSIAQEDNTYRYAMINYQAEVILRKTDTNDQALEGVQFDLYYDDELYLEGLESDEAGEIYLDGLAPGSYYFVETASVGGRLVDPRPIKFTVDEKVLGKPEVIEIDAYKNHYASASLLKTDALGRVVEASFALDMLENGVWKDLGLELHTQNGYLAMQNLAVGSYRLREIASDGKHLVNTEEVFFEIPEEHEDFYHIELDDFVNYKASLSIYKVDEENRILEGAEFVLEHLATGQRYTALVKGNQHLFEGLLPGEYRIIELRAPEGYLVLEEDLRWTIPKAYEGKYHHAINISNEAIVEVEEVDSTFITPEDVEEVMEASILPQTGQSAYKIYLSFVLMAFGLMLSIRSSRK